MKKKMAPMDVPAMLRQMADFFERMQTDEKTAVLHARIKEEFPNPTVADVEKIRKRSAALMAEVCRKEIFKEFGPTMGKKVIKELESRAA